MAESPGSDPVASSIPIAEALAPRILFSADAALLADAVVIHDLTQAIDVEVVTHTEAGQQTQAGPALVVIDGSLDDVQQLIDTLAFEVEQGATIDWLLLDEQSDGVQLLSEIIAQASQPYASVHIITHGDDGQFELGAALVNNDSLDQYAAEFNSWRSGLTGNADILVYACGVSASEQGLELAGHLATLTGADIATSANLTGHAAFSGDWVLEYSTGLIETENELAPIWADSWLTSLALDPASADINVPADTSRNDQFQDKTGGSQIASNGTTTIVVWESSNEIYFRRLQADGTPLDLTDQLIQNDNGINRSSPTIAIAANGDFVIAWQSGDSQDGNSDGIFAQRFNADGTAKARPADAYSASYSNSTEFLVNSQTDGKQEHPAIAMRDDGRFIIAWTSPIELLGLGSDAAMYAVFDTDGTRLQSETPASTNPLEDESRPAVAINPVDGSMTVVYEQSAGEDKVQVRRISPGGQVSGAPIDLALAGRDLSNPSVGITSDGITFVAAKGKGGSEDIFVWMIASDNTVINSVPIKVNEVSGGKVGNPEIAVDGNTVVVVWRTEQGADKKDIAARQLDGAGNLIGAELAANAYTDGDQRFPSVTLNGSKATIAWSGESAGDDKGIALRLFDVSQPGVQVTSAGATTGEDGSSVQVSISLSSQPLGNVTVNLLSSDPTEGIPDQASLTFTTANWNVPQIVNVQGQDDAVVDGDVDYDLLISVSSAADPVYDAVADSRVSLSNLDDDVPPPAAVGPVSDNDAAANQVSENAGAGVSVGITALATDADVGDTISYSISGPSSSLFAIDPVTGVVTTSGSVIDFETASSHALVIRATSSDGSTSERTFNIAVLDQNDNAPVITGGQSFQLDENAANGTVVGTVQATDPDTVGSLQGWTITGGTGQAFFGIAAGSGQITVTDSAGLDYETSTSFNLLVTASDGSNNAVATSVTINLSDVNEVPQGGNASVTAVEDTDFVFAASDFVFNDQDAGDGLNRILIDSLPASGSLVLNGVVLDGLTSLPVTVTSGQLGAGALVYQPAADVNGAAVASFQVRVVDLAGQASSANTQIINISAANDAPVFSSYSGAATTGLSIAENTTAVGTVLAGDVDGDAVQYFVSGPDAALFSVGLNNGIVSFNAAPDYETPADANSDNTYEVTIEARDGNGGSGFQTLMVSVTDQNDVAPVITPGQVFVVNENAANGTVVGSVTASDIDTTGGLQNWAITGGTGQALFSIDPGTGQLTVGNGAGLNFEASNSLTLVINVNDGVNAAAPQTITINLSNLNESPSSADGLVTTSEDTAYQYAVSDFGFNDPDAGDSLAAVRIESLPSRGQLTLGGVPISGLPRTVSVADLAAGQLVYLPPADQFGANLAAFNFRVVDGGGAVSGVQVQTVSVTGVNDAPQILGTRAAFVAAGGSTGVDSSVLRAVDVDDAPTQLTFTLDAAPQSGQLMLDGVSLTPGTTFTQRDLDAGRVTYVSQVQADAVDQLSLTVRDAGGQSVNGISLTLTSVASGVTAPPDDSAPATVTTPETAGETAAEAESETADEEEIGAGTLQTVADGPAQSDATHNGPQAASSILDGGDASGGHNVAAQTVGSRGRGVSVFTGSEYSTEPGSVSADLPGYSTRQADQMPTVYRRVSQVFDLTDWQQLGAHLDTERTGLLSFDQQVTASSVAVSTGLSVGYVLWLLRSGALISSVLASIPAWRSIDPLPVLSSMPAHAGADDDESLQEMLDRDRAGADRIEAEPVDARQPII